MELYSDIFVAFDVDKSGTLDRQECAAAFRTMLQHCGVAEVNDLEALLDAADENHDGSVSLEEFCKVLSGRLKVEEIPDLSYLKDFVALDSDKSGFLNGQEVKELYQKISSDNSANDLQAKLAAYSSQEISYRAFAEMLKK